MENEALLGGPQRGPPLSGASPADPSLHIEPPLPPADGGEEEEQLCRICRVHDPQMVLCRPCNCRGSIGLVHLECLREWVQTCTTQNRDWHSCEICRQRYRVQFRSKPLLTWNRPRFEPDDIRRLFFLLPMLILGIFYICVYIPLVIVDLFSPREEGGEGTGTVQDIIWLGMVLCLALCWLVLILRSCGFIKNLFMKWRNQNVTLLPMPGVEIVHPRTPTRRDSVTGPAPSFAGSGGPPPPPPSSSALVAPPAL